MMRCVWLGLALLGLSACGVSYDAVSNPHEFGFEEDAGTVGGAYNPSGFSKAEVIEQLRKVCEPPRLADYVERPDKDGLISFTAECEVSDFFGGEILGYRVTRLPSGVISTTAATAGYSFP